MNNTRNLVMRMKLNRDINFTDDFRKQHMIKNYGNYEKYDKNKVKTDYDDGKDAFGDD